MNNFGFGKLLGGVGMEGQLQVFGLWTAFIH